MPHIPSHMGLGMIHDHMPGRRGKNLNPTLKMLNLAQSVVQAFAGLLFAIGNPFLPPKGPAWAILLIWVVSGSCGYLVDKV